ncbi:hypothetical protein [Stieleria mannarensis]|uniref:hypothetical protein n=1 Tax=Stieleria mannarensis TaxID=2755585 RepID=UPI00160025A7|nr:hypothetical protein [Rhodopirellula sp. JC639]
METVYLETTVVGTIASRNHPDPIMLARQLSTRRWWSDASMRFDLKISDLVIAQCSAGDPTAASERLAVVAGIDVVTPREDAESLAEALMLGKAFPGRSRWCLAAIDSSGQPRKLESNEPTDGSAYPRMSSINGSVLITLRSVGVDFVD